MLTELVRVLVVETPDRHFFHRPVHAPDLAVGSRVGRLGEAVQAAVQRQARTRGLRRAQPIAEASKVRVRRL